MWDPILCGTDFLVLVNQSLCIFIQYSIGLNLCQLFGWLSVNFTIFYYAYEITCQTEIYVQGEGPGSDPQKWQELFKAAQAQWLNSYIQFGSSSMCTIIDIVWNWEMCDVSNYIM